LAFGWRQLLLQRSADPLLDLRAFKIRMFSLSAALMCLIFGAFLGAFILLPIYLLNVRGLSSLATGLLLLPGGLLMGLLAPAVGKIFDRYGPKILVPPAAAVIALAMLALTMVDQHTSVWWLLTVHITLSIALACFLTPTFATGLNPLPPSLYSHGSAIMGTLQQLAGAAGTALVITVMSSRMASLMHGGSSEIAAETAGLQTAFAVLMIFAVVAIVLALFLKNSQPANGSADHLDVEHGRAELSKEPDPERQPHL
jgi:DHA2 family lincomycin resistance protein-like MFS transporter